MSTPKMAFAETQVNKLAAKPSATFETGVENFIFLFLENQMTFASKSPTNEGSK